MLITRDQIIKRLDKPINSEYLSKAREKQKVYKHFFNYENPSLSYAHALSYGIADSKFNTFKKVHKNHPKSLIEKFITHSGNMFEAFGKSDRIDFGKDDEATL